MLLPLMCKGVSAACVFVDEFRWPLYFFRLFRPLHSRMRVMKCFDVLSHGIRRWIQSCNEYISISSTVFVVRKHPTRFLKRGKAFSPHCVDQVYGFVCVFAAMLLANLKAVHHKVSSAMIPHASSHAPASRKSCFQARKKNDGPTSVLSCSCSFTPLYLPRLLVALQATPSHDLKTWVGGRKTCDVIF